jgi:arylsulfatase A-like enzyme
LASDVVSIADEEKARNAPNLVLLFLEGVPPKFLSCGGCSLPTTPNIDEIAKDGAYFTRAYSQYPSTWDAHLTVMSGRFLKLSEYFWNNRFIGKYSPHNNLQKAVNLLGLEHNCHAKSAAATQYMVPPDSPGFFDNDEITDPIPLADGAADDFGARMESFVRELPPGGRFFIWEHMDVTHFPWKERPGFEHLKGKGYAVEQRFRQTVGHMDAQVGRLLKALKDTGVYERTAIVIVGDHGCEFYKHTKCYYTTKLYEESLLVPLIVRIPGVTDGRCVAAPVTHRDLLPTLFELFGVQTEKPLEGVSFLPLLKPETPDEEAARSEERLRNRDLLLLTHYDYFGVLSNFHWKLIFDRPRGAWLMFDLQNDPDEMTNIADAQPGKFQELRQKMIALIYAHPYVTAGLLFPDELTDPTREWR